MKLENETAIITGSTEGIGKVVAEVFLSEGGKVAICSRSEQKVNQTLNELKAKYGDSVIGLPCDVTKTEDLKKLVDKTIAAFGSARILITNAAINTTYGPFSCLSPDLVTQNARNILDVNIIGVMNSIAAVLPKMIAQKYGRIITYSGAGVDRPIENMSIYTASKGGIVTFSECLALELEKNFNDIKLNIFQPGMLKTSLTTTVQCVPNWKSNDEIKKDVEFVLEYLGGDITKRVRKMIPYVLPKTKANGKTFRGFSLFILIIRAIKMKRALKKRIKQKSSKL
ncbi:MAG: SDR family oxidoreductase [Candidatus Heimdallarchaeota archaeon]|nr:SDR family oxidoreductase [Candidatus Heimdallarchaeota archaeon]